MSNIRKAMPDNHLGLIICCSMVLHERVVCAPFPAHVESVD